MVRLPGATEDGVAHRVQEAPLAPLAAVGVPDAVLVAFVCGQAPCVVTGAPFSTAKQ